MNEAPEGLEHSHDNDKYARTPINNDWKDDTTKYLHTVSPEHEKAETLRMLGQGSHDPYYEHSKKNR